MRRRAPRRRRRPSPPARGAVTHLFNAMSQLSSRAPGLVGAALADPHDRLRPHRRRPSRPRHGDARRFQRQGGRGNRARLRRDAARRRRPAGLRAAGTAHDADGSAPDRRRRHARRRGDHDARRRALRRRAGSTCRSPTRCGWRLRPRRGCCGSTTASGGWRRGFAPTSSISPTISTSPASGSAAAETTRSSDKIAPLA